MSEFAAEPAPEIAAELAALKRAPFFAHLDERQLLELVRTGRRLSLDTDRAIFAEGDQPDGMYVLVAGSVRIFRHDSEGDEIQLNVLRAGDFFGELALLEGRSRSATAVTLERCEFHILDQAEFMALLASATPESIVRVFAALSRMARDANESLWKQEFARQRLRAETEIERHRSLAQMVAGVAHELNTPLGIANTAADIIEKRSRSKALEAPLGGDPATRAILDDVREASGLVRTSVLRAHKLVQSFKQISVRELSETVETVDLAQLVDDVVDLFKLNARQAHLTVRVEDRRSEPGAAWTGCPSYLTQVLLNLLTNVARYAYPAGRGGEVEIAIATDEVAGRPGIALTVRDFGRGIPPEHRDQVFEPFFTTGRGRGGTGLGLAIVYNLVTSALGGAIRLESEVEGGTAVTVTVPSVPPAGRQPMP